MRRPFVSKGLAVRRDFANLEETPFDSGRLRLATKPPPFRMTSLPNPPKQSQLPRFSSLFVPASTSSL
jgi:hypothetical protein